LHNANAQKALRWRALEVCEKTLKRVFSYTVPLVRFFHSLGLWERGGRGAAFRPRVEVRCTPMRAKSGKNAQNLETVLKIPGSEGADFANCDSQNEKCAG
jgi:hypothetical protein